MFKSYDNPDYVREYGHLYIDNEFWDPKYKFNEKVLAALLEKFKVRKWLDMFCGQGQYFRSVPDFNSIECIGIDGSAEQLKIAADLYGQQVRFIRGDLQTMNLKDHTYDVDLATIFWGAYSYFSGPENIASLLSNIYDTLSAGGVLYIEVIEPSTLLQFNTTTFAKRHNAHVEAQDVHESLRWTYRDHDETHILIAPSLEWFMDTLRERSFNPVNLGTVQTMHQIVATKLPK